MNIKEKYKANKFLYNCIFLSFLFFLHCFWGGMTFIVFPLLAIIVLTTSLEDGFSYICFATPFCIINNELSSIIFYSSITLYIFKVLFVIFKKEKHKLSKSSIVFICLFFVYMLLPFGEYNKNLFIKFCFFVFIFAIIITTKLKKEIYNFNKNFYIICYSLLLSCCFCLFTPISPFLQSKATQISLMSRFPALLSHPNILALFCNIILSILTYLIIVKSNKRKNIILFAILSLIGILTQSKMFIIILCLLLLCLMVYSFKINIRNTLITICSIAFIICLFIAFAPNFAIVIFNRFFGSIKECKSLYDFFDMIVTGRLKIWSTYLKYIFTHPKTLLFGNGLGAKVVSFSTIKNGIKKITSLSAHNFYISLIYQLGLIGTTLLFITIITLLKQNKKCKFNYLLLIPIITIMLIFFMEDTFLYII